MQGKILSCDGGILTVSLQNCAAEGEMRANNVGIMTSASNHELGLAWEDALPEKCRPEAGDKLAVCDSNLRRF